MVIGVVWGPLEFIFLVMSRSYDWNSCGSCPMGDENLHLTPSCEVQSMLGVGSLFWGPLMQGRQTEVIQL